jgi:hypothetical protein
MAKGHFTATSLNFELDGVAYTYAGRGRWSVQLATVVVNTKTAPAKQKDGTWQWREATVDELAAAQKLVNKIAAKVQAKADAKAAREAARAAKAASKPARVRKTKAAPVAADAPVTVASTDAPVGA